MHGYHIALFIHLLALLGAFAASSLVHFSMLRLREAGDGREALQWLGLAHRLARVFPVALLVLLGSGVWMVREAWDWDAGLVEAGLTGVVLLFVLGGAVEGGRARKVAAVLAADPAAAPGGVVRDAVWWATNWANTGIAIAVVFAMATKPSPAGAFAAVAVGAGAGACIGLLLRQRGAQGRERLRAATQR
jgi:hypothetical protein